MPTAVTYSRFSSSNQHETSIEAQQDAIARYAAQHGITIVHQYADRARSGTNDNRPEFQRMIADLRTNPVDLVLVHKVDRFARNRYDAAIYSRMIQERGARLVAVAQDFGDGPESIILEGLMQAMAEYYSLNLSSEIKKGKRVRAKQGKITGGISPFGYRHDGRGSLVPEPIEAHFVRELYDALLAGKPYAPVVERMRLAGVTGRLGSSLKTSAISRMLINPVYAGIFATIIDGEPYRIENHHPAIVSMAEHEEACRMIEQKINVGKEAKHREYLCSGLIYCECGTRMNGNAQTHRGKVYFYYNCRSRCGARGIPASEVESAACQYVNALLAPEIRTELAAALRSYQSGQVAASKRRAPSAKKEIAQLQAEIDAIIVNMSSGVLPPSVIERLGKQITEKEERIKILEELSAEPEQFDATAIEDYFAGCAAISPDDDPELVSRTLRRFIDRITIFPDRIEFGSTLDAWLRAHHPELAIPAHAVAAPDKTDSDAHSSHRSALDHTPSAERYDSIATDTQDVMFNVDPSWPSTILSIIFAGTIIRHACKARTFGNPVDFAQCTNQNQR